MNPYKTESGWWTSADNKFVNRYDTKEEAIAHVKYQKSIGSKANWHIQHIRIKFEESVNCEELWNITIQSKTLRDTLCVHSQLTSKPAHTNLYMAIQAGQYVKLTNFSDILGKYSSLTQSNLSWMCIEIKRHSQRLYDRCTWRGLRFAKSSLRVG